MPIQRAPARRGVLRARSKHVRRGGVPIGCVLAIVVPMVLLVAAMVWYDTTSVTIKGVVVRKEETVKLYTTVPMVDEPFTERKLLLHVRYTPPDSPMITWGVKTPANRFDRTHIGDEVSLRYLKAWPRITVVLGDRSACGQDAKVGHGQLASRRTRPDAVVPVRRDAAARCPGRNRDVIVDRIRPRPLCLQGFGLGGPPIAKNDDAMVAACSGLRAVRSGRCLAGSGRAKPNSKKTLLFSASCGTTPGLEQ